MPHLHHYKITTTWAGNGNTGTSNVRTYDRSHSVEIDDKPVLQLTTDNAAVGDKTKLNPEDLLVSAISSCHMLSYLYVCSLAGVVIMAYTDHATGTMIDHGHDGGHFQEVTLNPVVTIANASMIEQAIELHHEAHRVCYIAASVNFEVKCNAACNVADAS